MQNTPTYVNSLVTKVKKDVHMRQKIVELSDLHENLEKNILVLARGVAKSYLPSGDLCEFFSKSMKSVSFLK